MAGYEPSGATEQNVPDSERKRLKPNVLLSRSQGARRQLDGMNDSIFEPGGSKESVREVPRTPSGHGILHDEIWERQRITRERNEDERRKFEEDRNKDIALLTQRNRDLNAELAVLKATKREQLENNEEVSQQLKDEMAEIRIKRKQCEEELHVEVQKARAFEVANQNRVEEENVLMEEGIKRLDDLKERSRKEEHRCKRLTERGNNLIFENQEQIEKNEAVQRQIQDDNQTLLDRKTSMELYLDDLQSKKDILEQYMAAAQTKIGKPDMGMVLNPTGHEVHASGTGTTNTYSSTPAANITNPTNRVSFRPYDSRGNRHVDGGVYDPYASTGAESDGSQTGSYSGYTSGPQNTVKPNRGGSTVDGQSPIPFSRRSSMSAAMRGVHDANPCIAGLGIDCCSKGKDGIEVMSWSLSQGDRLRGSRNAARRVAKIPKPYNGYKPWKDEYQGFLDDMESSGWNKEESLPHLVSWLKDGPGKLAVEQWRNQYRGNGSYDELLTCASYLFGGLVAEDPMAAFKKRTQKPRESHKIFGLELQNLLTKARPKWRFDDDYFLEDLFMAFIRGLRDDDHQKVACDAWKEGASLVDLFAAIDSYDRKKGLLAGVVPSQRVSAMTSTTCDSSTLETEDSGSESSDSRENDSAEGSDENIGAIGSDGKYAGRDKYSKSSRDRFKKDSAGEKYKSSSKGYYKKQDREYRSKNENWKKEEPKVKASVVPSAVPAVPVATKLDTDTLAHTQQMLRNLEEKMDRMTAYRPRGPYVRPEDRLCYRCQGKGHRSFECVAPHPVTRDPQQYAGN